MPTPSKKRELQKLLNDGKTLFLDEKNTRIGVGKTKPQSTLHVGGDLKVEGGVNFQNIAAGSIANTASFLALNSDNRVIKTTASGAGGSARSVSGDTDNGIISWVTSDNTFAVESSLTFDGTDLTLGAAGKINFRDTNSFINSPTANDLEIVATDIVLDAGTLIDLQSDAVSIGEGGDTDVVLTFNANSNDGTITWMEDEAEFRFSSTIKAKYYYFTHHSFNDGNSSVLRYLPINTTSDVNASSHAASEWTHWIAPYDGKLVKVLIKCAGASGGGASGATAVGLEVNENSAAVAAVTASLAVDTTQTFDFTSQSHSFSAGDTLAVSIDPGAGMNDTFVTCVWEYDTTT
mgnify:FL=1